MGSAVERILPTAAIRQRIRVSWIFLFLQLVQISFFIFNKFHWPLICRAVEYHVPVNTDIGAIDTFFPHLRPERFA